eukprot:TRINITY_DN17543_c0_g1_i1.p1 TRINITY_DN17543_c0_g1~~TRINITY_DN17543_c0_g1_i1.p1  ORF type:complete len:468 (-),score=85.92 TRINITY_DN17543_c0_g1_i1:75-1478(-)
MTFQDAIIYPASLVALFMAYTVGANDLANALGTSVGSKALRLRTAVILAGIFEFLGVILLGRYVSDTLKSSIVNPSYFNTDPQLFALGMFCASIAASVWLLLATFLKLPVSTTHTIVGGILSFGLVEKGWSAINHPTIVKTMVGWLVSPLMGCAISFIFTFIVRKLVVDCPDSTKRARRSFSFFTSFTIAMITSFVIVKEKKQIPFDWIKLPWVAPVISVGLFVVIFLVVEFIILRYFMGWLNNANNEHILLNDKDENNLETDEENNEDDNSDNNSTINKVDLNNKDHIMIKNQQPAQRMFIPMMVITAASVAFAHGSNDIGNAIGPFDIVYEFWKNGNYYASLSTPWWIFLLAGAALILGLATLGHRVIETVGENIVPLTYSRGYCAQLSASITVLTATVLGIPISTTHTLVGSVTGTSLTSFEDMKQINWTTIFKILVSWIATFVIGGSITIILYLSLKGIFLVR